MQKTYVRQDKGNKMQALIEQSWKYKNQGIQIKQKEVTRAKNKATKTLNKVQQK